MSDTANTRPLSNAVYAAYGTGWIGGQVFRDVPALILLSFMITAIGVPPAVAGAAIFIPKLWIVFCDPLMGLWSDRTKSRWGRRRPFLFVGSILCGITFNLLFNIPHFDSGTAKGIYVGLIYTVASIAFSIYSVPYLTMASELSTNMHERTIVMSWRQVGLGFGLIASNVMPTLLIVQGGGGEAGHQFMAIVLGLICGVTMFVTFIGTRSVPLIESDQPAVRLIDQMCLAAKNRPFLILLGSNFAQLVGSAASYATIILFTVYNLKKEITFVSLMTLLMAIMVILTPPVWTALSRCIGKKPTFILSIICFFLSFLAFAWVEPGDDIALYVISLCIGTFNCGFSLMAFSMLLDTMAYDRKISGLNREGVFSGIWSAMDKTAFAFGALLAGLGLSYFGFQESAGGFVAQSPETIRGIMITYIGAPTIFAALSFVIMLGYQLNEHDLAESVEPRPLPTGRPIAS